MSNFINKNVLTSTINTSGLFIPSPHRSSKEPFDFRVAVQGFNKLGALPVTKPTVSKQ